MNIMRRIILIPVILLGMLLTCFITVPVKAADSSSGSYIDTDWTGYAKPGLSRVETGESYPQNNYSGYGLIAEMWTTKDGQKFDPVYCYNAARDVPDIGGTQYDRYGFFYGMSNRATDLGSPDKVHKIAAVLYAGYPNDGLNGLFDQYAQQSYQALMSNSTYRNVVSSNYSLNQFKQEVTQEVIWCIDTNMGSTYNTFDRSLVDPNAAYPGVSSDTASVITAYGQKLYQYAIQNPLTEEMADAKNLKIVDESGNQISDINKLVANMKNGGFTQEFKITGFAGAIEITPDADWEVYDANTNQKVSNNQLMIGNVYKLKYVGSNTTGNASIDLKANYKTLADSYFFQPKGVVDGSSEWQNLVCLATKPATASIPAVLSNDTTITTKTDVKFNKFEVTGSNELAGAKMEIIDKATGSKVAEWESKTNGVDYTFAADEGKEYILRETTAPKGYETIADTTFVVKDGKVTVTGDTAVTVDGKDSTLVLINDRETTKPSVTKETEVKFDKFDATGEHELSGAHMQVIDKATGKVVEEWDSTTGGVDHKFKAEEGKEYILREESAPEGYTTIVDTAFKVENGKIELSGDKNVKIDGKDSTLVLINDQLAPKKETEVKFDKFDATGEHELSGAHMQVIDKATGKVVEEWDSTTGGVDHTFKAEEGKEYILRETNAPKGYKTIVDTVFKVENGKIELSGDVNVKIDGKDSNLLLINDQLENVPVRSRSVQNNKPSIQSKVERTATGSKPATATRSRVIEIVSTGDSSNISGLITLLLGSLVVLGVCLTRRQNA